MVRAVRVAVCEDCESEQEALCSCIAESEIKTKVHCYKTGSQLLERFTKGKYDIIFMDIYLETEMGTEIVGQLREIDDFVVIAFTTTSTQHTLEGYRLGVLKYLEKPVRQAEVEEALALALLKKSEHKPVVTLQTNRKNLVIPLDDISYIEQKDQTVCVYTKKGCTALSQSIKLRDIAEEFDELPFLRCHHSFIVNLAHVKELNKKLCLFVMTNGGRVHIRKHEIHRMGELYEKHLFELSRGYE